MRADKFLVENGYFDTRSKAQAAIESGCVFVNGQCLVKSSQKLSLSDQIEAKTAHPYVSRAALKLVAGLDHFSFNPEGRYCLDVGASTGGFTEILLDRGARHVTAVDVGHGQLHSKLVGDPRILSLEGCDARRLELKQLPCRPDFIVCDASFISLTKVLVNPLNLLADRAEILALLKPQFEVGPTYVGKGGLVSNMSAINQSKKTARVFFTRTGFKVLDIIDSPITGGVGNQEYLIGAIKV